MSTEKWKKVRKQAVLPKGKIYLNTAAFGVPMRSSLEAEKSWLRDYQKDPFDFIAAWFTQQRATVRADLANFLGVSPKEIALAQNFSVPLRLLAPALPGNKVLVLENDYPSLLLPFAYEDREMILVTPNKEQCFAEKKLIQALKKHKPDWFIFSHVQYLTGQVLDATALAKVCHGLGIRVLVDITQSLGAQRISFEHFDVAIGSAYKWMMAGFGNGFCYVKDELQPQLQFSEQGAQHLGYWSHEMHMDPLHLFLEPGHLDFAPFARLHQAIRDQRKLGLNAIELQVKCLTDQLVEGLKRLTIKPIGGWDMPRHGIVSIPYSSKRMKRLKARNIVCVRRGNGIRISPHIYNTPGEIKVLLKALAEK